MAIESIDFLSDRRHKVIREFSLRVSSSGYLLAPTPVCPHVVHEFRQRVSSSGYLLPPSAGCPPQITPEGFVQSYAFDVDDLMTRIDNQVVVFHGELSDSIGSQLYLLYQSSPIIYAHRDLGRVDLNVEQIRGIIEGRVGHWGVLGHKNKPLIPFCHGGIVQNAVFRTLAKSCFGARHARGHLHDFDSYEGLAKAASEQKGSLVFGLRPEFAVGDMLRPISISGKWPGLPVNANEYPSLGVWLSLPHHFSVQALVQYLDLVASRLEKDVSALRKLADPVGRLEAHKMEALTAAPG